jgi:tetratricopeptide (TPR) repeat protein/SAM-dependent methyltransferase
MNKTGRNPHRDYDRGNALQAQGKLDEAIDCYRRALAYKPDFADAHTNLGTALHRLGKLNEAVTSYRAALSFTPYAADLHYNLGSAFMALGRPDEAVACFRSALSVKPDHAFAHGNLGNVLHASGKPDEAISSYRKAITLRPDYVDAHFNLGVALHAQGKLDEAIACYQNALALRPDFAAALGNLGFVLQTQGKLAPAIACYQKAIAVRPSDARMHNNLGNALDELGRVDEAVSAYKRALALAESSEIKANFARCVKNMTPLNVDVALRRLLTRAISEPWTRPSDLASASTGLIRADPVAGQCIERAVRAWPMPLAGNVLFGPTGLSALSGDPLLRSLLENSQVCDLAMERFLTMVRRVMLDAALEALAGTNPDAAALAFYCAIARQCFLNEYTFADSDDERARVAALEGKVVAALNRSDPIAALWVVAVAAYLPLSGLTSAAMLLQRSWPECVRALLVQQIAEPAEEKGHRDAMRTLTTIDDAVSQSVRRQYEENPYPRWIRLPPAPPTRSLNAYLRQQFPFADFEPAANGAELEILIAGCGTGQETLETAQQFPRARVLAVDLSLSSLGYAKRKSIEAGIANVEYAQADILRLASIGRTFDLIASVGVLHHLADPIAGWRELLSLLRPGGFMRLGLYSECARRDVVAARTFIGERGYSSTPPDIRRARQDLIDNGAQFGRVTSSRDFYVMSECRDLLFHVQEHRFTLAQLSEMLGRLGLRFIGFLLEPHVLHAYRTRFPTDRSLTQLDGWSAFEAEFPETFAGMYRFLVQKPGAQHRQLADQHETRTAT